MIPGIKVCFQCNVTEFAGDETEEHAALTCIARPSDLVDLGMDETADATVGDIMNIIMSCIRVYTVIMLSAVFFGCEDDSAQVGDVVPPAPVTDLVVGRPLGNSLTAAWTTTGDDGIVGQATFYDLRYSKEPITEESWSRATPFEGSSHPFEAGELQGRPVFGLEASTIYYFAVKMGDEDRNWSTISNIVSEVTAGYSDSLPPATIEDLAIDSTSAFSITLSWTAPGDDGMEGRAAIYDARFSVLPIENEADWRRSARLIGEPFPEVAGELQKMTITGLIPDREFFFSIRAGDEIINWSELGSDIPGNTRAAESIPPSAITDLTVIHVTTTSVELSWTAPGDDGDVGQATGYDIRHYNFPFTEETWAYGAYVIGEPAPGAPGTKESMLITGLTPFRVYNMAIKAADEIPNWSPLSNVVSFVTIDQVNTAPAEAIGR